MLVVDTELLYGALVGHKALIWLAIMTLSTKTVV
jgi:hypothetical protein